MRDALGQVESALVLGGTSEIGQATVRALVAGRTRRVVLAGRDSDALERVAAGLRSQGHGGEMAVEVTTASFDATAVDTHEAAIDHIFDDHGDLDLVLLAFGVLGDQSDFDQHPEAAARAVTTNYVGAVSSGLAVANRLRAQGHGTIVVLSSVAGERARASNYVYGSSKAGLDAFAQGLGDALVGSGVRVLVVRPGFVKGRMTEGLDPQPFVTTPEEVAAAIVTGLERNREIIWAPRLLRHVFAVMRHLPRPLWRVVSAR